MAICALGVGFIGVLYLKSTSEASSKSTTPPPVAQEQVAVESTTDTNAADSSKIDTADTPPTPEPPSTESPVIVVAEPNGLGDADDLLVEEPSPEITDATEPQPRQDVVSVQPETDATTETENEYPADTANPSELLAVVVGESQALASDLVAAVSSVTKSSTSLPPTVELETGLKEPESEPIIVAEPGLEEPELAASAIDVKASQEVAQEAVPAEPLTKDSQAEDIQLKEAPTENVVAGDLTPETDETVGEFAILNPRGNQLPVWFVANRQVIQLKPGERFARAADKEVEIRFARGGDFGDDKVVIPRGQESSWSFSVTREAGWKLAPNN